MFFPAHHGKEIHVFFCGFSKYLLQIIVQSKNNTEDLYFYSITFVSELKEIFFKKDFCNCYNHM